MVGDCALEVKVRDAAAWLSGVSALSWGHPFVYFGRWCGLPRRLKWMVCVAFAMLCFSTLAVHLLPFRHVAHWLGEKGMVACDSLRPEKGALAQDWGWAVNVVAQRVPWTATCLIRALAAQLWLRRQRIPATVYIGVLTGKTVDGHFFDAHAWLCCDDKILTGAEDASRFKAIASFGTRMV